MRFKLFGSIFIFFVLRSLSYTFESSEETIQNLNEKLQNRRSLLTNRIRNRAEKEMLRKEVNNLVETILKDVEKTWKQLNHRETFTRDTNEREILLMGDSLLGLPSVQFQLGERLKKYLTDKHRNFKISVNMQTSPGARAASMRDKLLKKLNDRRDAKHPPPEAIIIYWDSDLVDIDDPSNPKVKELYIRNLIGLLKIAQSEITYVAVAGPSFSKNRGELPEEWIKEDTYETYVMIHQAVARLLRVEHINTRRKFQDYILSKKKQGLAPKELEKVHNWDEFDKVEGGIITFDGQHTHETGTQLLVEIFGEALDRQQFLWIDTKLKQAVQKLIERSNQDLASALVN